MWAALSFGLTKKFGTAKRFGSRLQAMSLIPSESYSFPDHFTRTVVPSRKPKNEEPEPVPLETRRQKSAIVPLPDPDVRPPTAPRLRPKPIRSKTPVAAPNPALRRAGAPPPRIPDAPMRKMPLPPTLKPKVRWNTRAPAMDHPAPTSENGTASVAPITAAPNAIPMNPPRVMRPPRLMPPPQASVVKTAAPVQMQSVPAKPRPVAGFNPQADFFATLGRTREKRMPSHTREVSLF